MCDWQRCIEAAERQTESAGCPATEPLAGSVSGTQRDGEKWFGFVFCMSGGMTQ